MPRFRYSAPLALAVAALAIAAPAANAVPGGAANSGCFRSQDWAGWSAPGDGDMLYLRVGMRDIYRVELSKGSHARKHPDYFLVNRVRGSSWICSPLDLDLILSYRVGIRPPLIARSLRKLMPEEVAAIPRKDMP